MMGAFKPSLEDPGGILSRHAPQRVARVFLPPPSENTAWPKHRLGPYAVFFLARYKNATHSEMVGIIK